MGFLRVAATGALLAASAAAFTPASSPLLAPCSARLNPAACRATRAQGMKMVVGGGFEEGAQTLLSVLDTVPFVDEVTGEAQGFTAPVNHFASVIGLWVLFALPVWSAAYKQAGCDTPDWFGVSQVSEDAPGIGMLAKASPEYQGPSFREGLEYVFSFLWKPPILIAWKPRTDLDRESMDPSRDTVVSSLYKGLGGALDKTAVYDEEDQLLILSDIVTFEETDLGRRREKQALASGNLAEDTNFGRSLIEISERTRKGSSKSFSEKTVNIAADELAALRAAAASKGGGGRGPAVKAAPAPKPTARKPAPK
eukprot:CAMPEP_0181343496 /NCGR_PEP_ID=MMETSP1101-20121128/31617_1 /TAXON_ID=46948 /ORGANISM="Rhodomonas abbreviata, Strain Caron Lab Isolate" /LENGTH=309 /DNA_ID=CAMNT_0023455129 /DNA_START=15 /DNA_END=941 /DNA_ORIENTATION=+